MRALLALAFVACSAQAADWSVHAGGTSAYERVTVARTGPSFQKFGSLSIQMEGSASFWNSSTGNMVQLSAVPIFHYPLTSKIVAEAGIGVSYFSKTQFAGSDISTHFQFADHIGVFYRFAPDGSIGIRASHFSNGGIKKPNPGLNALQLTYTESF